jgi:hypothetical protein
MTKLFVEIKINIDLKENFALIYMKLSAISQFAVANEDTVQNLYIHNKHVITL